MGTNQAGKNLRFCGLLNGRFLCVGEVPPSEQSAGITKPNVQVGAPHDDAAPEAQPADKAGPARLEDPLTRRIVSIVSENVHSALQRKFTSRDTQKQQ